MSSTILLTGATGYIASHTWLALLAAGYRVIGVDNFSNSSPQVLPRLERLTGSKLIFEQADVNDGAALSAVLARHKPAAGPPVTPRTGGGCVSMCSGALCSTSPRASSAWVEASRSEENCAKAAISRYCASSSLILPATCFIALI